MYSFQCLFICVRVLFWLYVDIHYLSFCYLLGFSNHRVLFLRNDVILPFYLNLYTEILFLITLYIEIKQSAS